MNTFPFLNLPMVPVREVLKLWNPIEIVTISFCSKKTYTIAKKNLNISKQLSLSIHEFDRRRIIIWFSKTSSEIAISKHEGHIPEGSYDAVINNHSLSIAQDKNKSKLTTYWEDENLGLNELTKYIADIFNYPLLSRVSLDTQHKNLSLFHWINQQYPEKVKELFIESNNENTSEADIKQLLDSSCKLYKTFIFRSRPLPSFQYEFKLHRMEWFALQYAEWITLEHLFVLTNQLYHVFLADTSLSNQNLNDFFKEWIASESVLKTEKLIVRGTKVNIDEVFEGIEREEEDPDFINQLPMSFGTLTDADRKGFNIYRENGVKALIITQGSGTTVQFEMCIKSDYSASV